MARVTVEDCIDKVDNRFDLVLMASHRARAISSGAQIHVARDNDKNPVVALREIADSKLAPNDLKEDVIHALAEAGRGRRTRGRGRSAAGARPLRLARPRRRGAVRPHDRGRFAARPRRHGASAGTRRRRRVRRANRLPSTRSLLDDSARAGLCLPRATYPQSLRRGRSISLVAPGRFAILAARITRGNSWRRGEVLADHSLRRLRMRYSAAVRAWYPGDEP